MSPPDWRLALILPNLRLGQHQRSPAEFSEVVHERPYVDHLLKAIGERY